MGDIQKFKEELNQELVEWDDKIFKIFGHKKDLIKQKSSITINPIIKLIMLGLILIFFKKLIILFFIIGAFGIALYEIYEDVRSEDFGDYY